MLVASKHHICGHRHVDDVVYIASSVRLYAAMYWSGLCVPSDPVHSGVLSRISNGSVSIYSWSDHCVLHRCVSELTGYIDMSYTMHLCSGPAEAIRMLATKASHPEFPTFSVALATLPVLANGATVDLWGKQEPLSCSMYNVNYSQTRIGTAPSV